MKATKYVPVLVVSHLMSRDLSEVFTGRVKLPRSEAELNLSYLLCIYCLFSYDCSSGDLDGDLALH